MKHFPILILLFIFVSFTSCSSNDPEQDLIIGTWQGDVIQPGFGTISLVIAISTLNEGSAAGRLSSEVTDISNCDDTIFFCELGTCSADWIYNGRSGSAYLYLEKQLSGSSCGDGNINATVNNDELRFTWTDVTNDSNVSSGILTRQ